MANIFHFMFQVHFIGTAYLEKWSESLSGLFSKKLSDQLLMFALGMHNGNKDIYATCLPSVN